MAFARVWRRIAPVAFRDLKASRRINVAATAMRSRRWRFGDCSYHSALLVNALRGTTPSTFQSLQRVGLCLCSLGRCFSCSCGCWCVSFVLVSTPMPHRISYFTEGPSCNLHACHNQVDDVGRASLFPRWRLVATLGCWLL